MKNISLFLILLCSVFLGSCDNQTDELVAELNSGNYEIDYSNFNTVNGASGGKNVVFSCIATNNSKVPLNEVPVTVDLAYAPNANTPAAVYQTTNGGTIDHQNNQPTATDPMSFGNTCCGTQVCCNSCCPGIYTCTITAYDPNQPSKVVTSSAVSVKVDAVGNYQVL